MRYYEPSHVTMLHLIKEFLHHLPHTRRLDPDKKSTPQLPPISEYLKVNFTSNLLFMTRNLIWWISQKPSPTTSSNTPVCSFLCRLPRQRFNRIAMGYYSPSHVTVLNFIRELLHPRPHTGRSVPEVKRI